MADVNKSLISELKKSIGSVSSSDFNKCSVRVHDNPLLEELFVDGRFRSDLEFALQDKDAQAINAIAQSERVPKYSDSAFPRHLSASDYSDIVDRITDDMNEISADVPAADAPAADAPAVDAPAADK